MAQIVLSPSVRSLVLLFASAIAAGQSVTQNQQATTQQAAVPVGLLEKNTLLTVYGRGFGVDPILGILGTYRNFDELASGMRERAAAIAAVNGGKGVVEAIHLIYAMAIPCTPRGDCLQYIADRYMRSYIESAAAHGWAVILDSQLGRSTPVAQVRRMIAGGYLRYDNVHVALDPEFHVESGHDDPGIPIGTVDAAQINEVQQLLDRYVADQGLRTKKILIVHQFGDAAVHDGVPYMIQDKKSLRTYPNVELAIDMDGLGSPLIKVHKYNRITNNHTYPFLQFRGIKIFYRDPGEVRGHFDKPPMTVDQIFGTAPVPGGLRMDAKPDVVIIA